MSTNFEWAGVEDAPINYYNLALLDEDNRAELAHELDAEEIGESGYVLVIGGENGIVIEAERSDQLVEFARTLLRMAEWLIYEEMEGER